MHLIRNRRFYHELDITPHLSQPCECGRLGYMIDFEMFAAPWFRNIQWPFGLGLYAQNKPESFEEHEEEERFFYFPPMFFLGFRF